MSTRSPTRADVLLTQTQHNTIWTQLAKHKHKVAVNTTKSPTLGDHTLTQMPHNTNETQHQHNKTCSKHKMSTWSPTRGDLLLTQHNTNTTCKTKNTKGCSKHNKGCSKHNMSTQSPIREDLLNTYEHNIHNTKLAENTICQPSQSNPERVRDLLNTIRTQHQNNKVCNRHNMTTWGPTGQGSNRHEMWNLCSTSALFSCQFQRTLFLQEKFALAKYLYESSLILTETVFVHLFTCTCRSSLGLESAPKCVRSCSCECFCAPCTGWGLESAPSVCVGSFPNPVH